MIICPNCGTECDSLFCPNCGQEKISKRLGVKSILHDVTLGIINWENRVIMTFRLLLTQPGNFIHGYIRGKRRANIKPFFILPVCSDCVCNCISLNGFEAFCVH